MLSCSAQMLRSHLIAPPHFILKPTNELGQRKQTLIMSKSKVCYTEMDSGILLCKLTSHQWYPPLLYLGFSHFRPLMPVQLSLFDMKLKVVETDHVLNSFNCLKLNLFVFLNNFYWKLLFKMNSIKMIQLARDWFTDSWHLTSQPSTH